MDNLGWDDEMETLFFQAFVSRAFAYKPTGINKHFHMLIAYHRFVKAINRNVDIELLWSKLEDLYDLDRLDIGEKFPFPNEKTEFKLPEKMSEEILEEDGIDRRSIKKSKKRR